MIRKQGDDEMSKEKDFLRDLSNVLKKHKATLDIDVFRDYSDASAELSFSIDKWTTGNFIVETDNEATSDYRYLDKLINDIS